MIDDEDSVDDRELARRRREVAGGWADKLADWDPEIISAIVRELIARLPAYEIQKHTVKAAASDVMRMKRMREGK